MLSGRALPAFQFRALCGPVAFVPITDTGLCGAGGEYFTGRGCQSHLPVGFTLAEGGLDGAAIGIAQQSLAVEFAIDVLAFVLLAVGKHLRAGTVEGAVGKLTLVGPAVRVGEGAVAMELTVAESAHIQHSVSGGQ